jgi:hypothetical protein
MQVPDIINSLGVSLILMAFFLLTIRKMDSQSRMYNLLNLIGASLACYGSWLIGAIPFMVLEGIWAAVALLGLMRGLVKR